MTKFHRVSSPSSIRVAAGIPIGPAVKAVDQYLIPLLKKVPWGGLGTFLGKSLLGVGALITAVNIYNHEFVAQTLGEPNNMKDIVPNADNLNDKTNSNQVDPRLTAGDALNGGNPVAPSTSVVPGGSDLIPSSFDYNSGLENITDPMDLLPYAYSNRANDTSRFAGYNIGFGLLDTKVLGIDTSQMRKIFSDASSPTLSNSDGMVTPIEPTTPAASPATLSTQSTTPATTTQQSDIVTPQTVASLEELLKEDDIDDMITHFTNLIQQPNGLNQAIQYASDEANSAKSFIQQIQSLNLPGLPKSAVTANNQQHKIVTSAWGGNLLGTGLKLLGLESAGNIVKNLDDSLSTDNEGDTQIDKSIEDPLNNYAHTQQTALQSTEQTGGLDQTGYSQLEQSLHAAGMLLSATPQFVEQLSQLAMESQQPLQTLLPTTLNIVRRCQGDPTRSLSMLQPLADYEAEHPGVGTWYVSNRAAMGLDYSSELMTLQATSLHMEDPQHVIDPKFRSVVNSILGISTPNTQLSQLNDVSQMSRQEMKQQYEALNLVWQTIWARAATMRQNYLKEILRIINTSLPGIVNSPAGDFLLKSWNVILTAGSIASNVHNMLSGHGAIGAPKTVPAFSTKSKFVRVADTGMGDPSASANPPASSNGTNNSGNGTNNSGNGTNNSGNGTNNSGNGTNNSGGAADNSGGDHGTAGSASAVAQSTDVADKNAQGNDVNDFNSRKIATYLYSFTTDAAQIGQEFFNSLQAYTTENQNITNLTKTPLIADPNIINQNEEASRDTGAQFGVFATTLTLPSSISAEAKKLLSCVSRYYQAAYQYEEILNNLAGQVPFVLVKKYDENCKGDINYKKQYPTLDAYLKAQTPVANAIIQNEIVQSQTGITEAVIGGQQAEAWFAVGEISYQINQLENKANSVVAGLNTMGFLAYEQVEKFANICTQIQQLYYVSAQRLNNMAYRADQDTASNLTTLAQKQIQYARGIPTKVQNVVKRMYSNNSMSLMESNDNPATYLTFNANTKHSKFVRVADKDDEVVADNVIQKYYDDLIPGYGRALNDPVGNENIPTEQLAPAKHQSPLLRKRKIKLYD